jgi:aerotaxis receptor
VNSTQEVKLDSKSFLVSETDKNGVIRFANDEFCEVAGFTMEELYGKPHSIVRHPDMPKEAFKDMWETIQSDKKWKGFVKNKTKDGGYYWVFATVYPFSSCNGVKGYISCRRKASDQEIKKYSDVYKTMN